MQYRPPRRGGVTTGRPAFLSLSRARAAVQDRSHYDIEIRLPDGRALTGPLEEAPPGQAAFPLADPPSWLRWI